MSAAADKPLLLTGPKRAPQPRRTSNRPAAVLTICAGFALEATVKDWFASPMALAASRVYVGMGECSPGCNRPLCFA